MDVPVGGGCVQNAGGNHLERLICRNEGAHGRVRGLHYNRVRTGEGGQGGGGGVGGGLGGVPLFAGETGAEGGV